MASSTGSYNLIRTATTTSTAIVINQLLVPAGFAAEITRAWCNQSTSTTSGQTRTQLLRYTTACTVSSTNPALMGINMQASKCPGGSSATGITATVDGTAGAVQIAEGWNIINGWVYLPVPEERIMTVGSTTSFVCLKFPSAPPSADYTSGMEWLEY